MVERKYWHPRLLFLKNETRQVKCHCCETPIKKGDYYLTHADGSYNTNFHFKCIQMVVKAPYNGIFAGNYKHIQLENCMDKEASRFEKQMIKTIKIREFVEKL